ncbi:MAG: hypothetical protein N2443_04605 [Blastocatellia bacterium]|nr:hypothetical protein [Blastocatellia bacterium]
MGTKCKWPIWVIAIWLAAWPAARAESSYIAANFSSRCSNCWPGWNELLRPLRGVGPCAQNGLAFLFINGSFDDPTLNQAHLHFSRAERVTEVVAEFQFNNATIGGRLLLTNGNFHCLPQSYLPAFVTDELFILTLRDDGRNWYGAFLGDLTLLEPEFAPRPERAESYTTVGLMEKSGGEFRVRKLVVIPQITRFSPIRLRVAIEETPEGPQLRAVYRFASGRSLEISHPLDPADGRPSGRAGIVYMVGNGSPCANLVQREIAVRSFLVR